MDGCGKGVQIKLLSEYFDSVGIKYVLNKVPGATPFGHKVRDILFDSITTRQLDGNAASCLYLASHYQSYRDIVEPALKEGTVVVSDRWDSFSGIAYGIYGGVKPIDEVLIQVRKSFSFVIPDITFLLTGDVKVFLSRAVGRVTELHECGKIWARPEILEKVQDEYIWMTKYPELNITKVVADRNTPEEIFRGAILPTIHNRKSWAKTVKLLESAGLLQRLTDQ